MSEAFDTWIRGVMSGKARGLGPAALRATLGTIEPAYAGVAGLRNRLFDHGLKRVRRLPRPVISVGNLTTGGTGKTPFVQWLVRELTALGRQPSVLMRGYARRADDVESDEERVLRESLPGCPIFADPDRVAAGTRALSIQPLIDCFVLDDGFQHRRLARDLDIVLVDATNPFGYEHVLPRGMLRERPAGLARADIVVITRVERVSPEQLAKVDRLVRGFVRPTAPILAVPYRMDEVRIGDAAVTSVDRLAGRSTLAVSAIGNPQAFEDGLQAAGLGVVGRRRFGDHHRYTQADVDSLLAEATRLGADLLLTTDKDWAKLRDLRLDPNRVGRVGVRVEATEALRDTIRRAVTALPPAPEP